MIDVLGLVQGLFLGAILVVESKKQKPTLFLGLFLIAYSFELLNAVLEDLRVLDLYPNWHFLPINFLYLTIPLFYLYVKRITGNLLKKKDILVVLWPGIAEFVLYAVIFFFPTEYKVEVWKTENALGVSIALLELLALPYSIYYVVRILRHIARNRKRIENYYSNTEGKLLNWAKGVILFILCFHFLWVIEAFQEASFFDTYTYPVLAAINVTFIFWIGLSGLRQSKIIGEKGSGQEEALEDTTIDGSENETQEFEDADYQKLVDLMVEGELYKESNLSLSDLSKASDIPQRKLSQLINTTTGKNFNQFVNYYRVEEAKKLLKDSEYNNLSMLGIAYDAGFSSKASFFSVFKKFTNLTPNAYKNG